MKTAARLSTMTDRKRIGCALALAVALTAVPVRADDPLDETDGTEGWDQVVLPVEKKPAQEKQEEAFKREIASWESIRQLWEYERARYLNERALHKRLAKRMMRRNKPSAAVINDSNVDQKTLGDDWGDAPGEQWLVPANSVDRAIDAELQESHPPAATRAAPPPRPAPAPLPPPKPATAIIPPPAGGGDAMPDAFTRPQGNADQSGGLAPTSPDPDAALPPPPPPKKKPSADEGARAAAEMLKKQQEEEARRKAEEKAREEREAAEGAAAAARLLKQQEEEARKEQERLRQKANLETDDEGQVVDPDLKREIEEDDEPEEE